MANNRNDQNANSKIRLQDVLDALTKVKKGNNKKTTLKEMAKALRTKLEYALKLTGDKTTVYLEDWLPKVTNGRDRILKAAKSLWRAIRHFLPESCMDGYERCSNDPQAKNELCILLALTCAMSFLALDPRMLALISGILN